MHLSFRLWALLSLFCLSEVARAGVDFARQVQPFFAENCLECHGPDDSKGGLVLTSREGALAELESGARGVVPGKPEASEIIRRLLSEDPKEMMPPPKQRAKHAVTSAQVSMLKQWITEGADYVAHWAYQPIQRVEPSAKDQHPIDSFLRERLQREGFTPAAKADKVTLIRRVHYDLLGLPPTPEEVDAFVADASERAYEAMVDRALASGHFGERWGRHWLDMARYADSDGYEKDRARPDAWRYRDWVIRAVNEDMPFDQFTIEQLAGDLLPEATPEQVVATSFNRQTLTNTEGGTDQEQFRVEACFDRTETMGTIWLGLTVGCARCHTHKYDEITHHEYFQLFAFFNNGDEVTRQAPVSPEAWAEYERKNGAAARSLIPLKKKLDAAKNGLRAKLPEWEKRVQARIAKARAQSQKTPVFVPLAKEAIAAKSEAKVVLMPQEDGSFLAKGKQAKQDVYEVDLLGAGLAVSALRIEVLPDAELPKQGPGRSTGGNFVLSEVSVTKQEASGRDSEVLLHSAKADYEQQGFAAVGVLDGKLETGWAVSGGIGKRHELTLQLVESVTLAPGEKLRLKLTQHHAKGGDHCIGRFRISTAAEETEASIAPAEVLRILNEEPKRRNPVVIQALYDWMERVDPEVRAIAAEIAKAEAGMPKAPLMDVRVIGQRQQDPRATRLMLRGDFLQPADPVVPKGLAVLPPVKAADGGTPSRLDLARWLVSDAHPLTPRVTVNHLWTQLFGEGLVRTVADFGVRGDAPTHPELLDWLASEFVRQGWSRKKLIRLILMSQTYQQSSDPSVVVTGKRRDEEHRRLNEADPLNTLLWRQNRLRVQGEVVRDLHLAAAGLLSRKIGGPSVFPPMPKDIAELSYAGNFKWEISKGEDRYRRGLYTFFKRTAPHPELMTFDCPDANLTNVRRTVSNTPLQALTTLNAESYVEAATALAGRVLAEATLKNDEAKLAWAFRLCLSRPPSEAELASLGKLLKEARYHYEHASPEEVKAMAGGEVSVERAALAATTRIILNTDEFITRG